MDTGVWSDIRRRAFERFLYDFVTIETGDDSEESSAALFDFVPVMYKQAGEGSCFATIVDAVCYTNYSARCRSSEARLMADECLGKGIGLLQKMLQDSEQARTDEALGSVYLLGLFEVSRFLVG